MNSHNLDRWLGLAANLAVLIGIGVVVFELQQNRTAIQSQTRNSITDQVLLMQSNNLNAEGLVEARLKSNAGEALTPKEAEILRANTVMWFRHWENVQFQYRNGLYDESEYQAQRGAWIRASKAVHIRKYWKEMRPYLSPHLVEELDQHMGKDT